MPGNPTVVFPEPGDVEIEDRERPTPSTDEVVIETEETLISSGTELTVLSGDYPDGSFWDEFSEYPHVPGYSNVGVVRDVGSDVDDAWLDTRVASWTPHAAFVTVSAEDCIAVPDDIRAGDATLFAIAQIVMNGIRRGRVDWGERVVVYGLGILGQLAVRMCQIAGVESVIGVDIAEDRLAQLPDDPGVKGINPTEVEDVAEAVRNVTGGDLADVVFEVTGNPDVIVDELDALKNQGRMVLLSSPHGKTEFDFHDHCNAPSYEIIGAHQLSTPDVATPANPWTKQRHTELFFQYIRDSRFETAPLFSHVESYDAAPGLYTSLLDDRSSAMAVRLQW